MRTLVPTLASLLLSLACGEGGTDSPEADRTLVADSAGVRVVTNRGASDPLSWTIEAEPFLRIGGSQASEQEQLYQVVAAVITEAGYVIANAGTSELRFYDGRGQRIGTAGREGEGPGEFLQMRRLGLKGSDSLMVYDIEGRHISVLDADGVFGRRLTLQPPRGVPGVGGAIGFLSDGSILAQGFTITEGQDFDGLRSFPAHTFLFDDAGNFVTDFGIFESGVSYFQPLANGGFTVFRSYFAWSNSRLAVGERIAFVDARTGVIEYRDRDGGTDQLLRRELEAREPTPAEVDRFRTEQIEALGPRREQGERVYAEMPVPEVMPMYGPAVADRSGDLWVQIYRAFDDEPSTWEVFAPDGALRGRIALPRPERLMAIGDDVLVTLATDDLDVEEVRVYRLNRASGM